MVNMSELRKHMHSTGNVFGGISGKPTRIFQRKRLRETKIIINKKLKKNLGD